MLSTWTLEPDGAGLNPGSATYTCDLEKHVCLSSLTCKMETVSCELNDRGCVNTSKK